MTRPRVNSEGQKELDKAIENIDRLSETVTNFDPFSTNAPKLEQEEQTKLSNREVKNADAPYIKPLRSINSKEKFDEKYRKDWEKAWEYIKCVVENHEVVGEAVELWTKRFAGDPAHFWKIPVNKPVYIPRLLAEQLSKCNYHRLRMEDSTITSSDGMATYHGSIVADHKKDRISVKTPGFSF